MLFAILVTLVNYINGRKYFWEEPPCGYSKVEALPSSQTISNGIDVKPVAYCSPTGATPWNDWITGFSMGAINRSASDPDTDKSTPVGNFTGLGPAVFATGDTATFSISARAPWVTAPFIEYWAVYVDYNHDEDFGDANELAFSSNDTVSTTGLNQFVINGDFIIPVTADTGTTRLRIVMKRGGTPDPCQSTSFNGEVEDYSINIQLGNTPSGADLSLTSFTADTMFFHTNDTIALALILNNSGPDTATNIAVDVPFLNTDFNYLSADPSSGSYNSTSKIWTVASLPPSQSDTLILLLKAIQQAHSVTILAQVDTVDVADPDSSPGNRPSSPAIEDDEKTITLTVPTSIGIDLAFLPISISPNEITIYNYNTFTFVLKNQGTQSANSVVVEVPFPSSYAFDASTNASIGSYDSYTKKWTIGTLVANGTATLNLVLFALQDTSTVGMYAQVFSMTGSDTDSTPGNGTCCTANEDDEVGKTIYPLGETPPEADLAITAFEADPSTFQLGDTLAFTLILSNDGPDTANDIEVRLPFDTAYFDYVQNTASIGTFSQATQKWTISALPSDSTTTLVIDLSIIQAADTLSIAAQVSAVDEDDPDSTPSNYPSSEDDEAVVLVVQDILTVQLTKTDITIHGAADGAIDVTASGGVPPYSFLWSNGATTEDISNLPPNTYTITVTDATSQTVTGSATVIEINEVDVVWKDIPANVFIDHEANTYEKAYASPALGLRSCNILPAGQDSGYVEFKLLEDMRTTDDWLYIGFIEDTTTLQGLGTQDANFLIGVRSNAFLDPGEDNVIVQEKGTFKGTDKDGGYLNDVYRIERLGDTIKYWRNGSLLYLRDPSEPGPPPSTLNLQVVYYVFHTGPDLQNKVELSTSLHCDDLYIRYIKQDASQDSLGSIELIPQGGYPPYAIYWDNATYQGLRLDSLSPGGYRVTVVDNLGHVASTDIHLYEMSPIVWDSVGSNVDTAGIFYIATPSTPNITRILLGDQVIPASGSGKISFTLQDSVGLDFSTQFIIGFRNIDRTYDEYGFYGIGLNAYSMTAYKYLKQVTVDSILLIDPLDFARNFKDYVYEIELHNGEFIFWKNGKEVYRDTVPQALSLLRADAWFLSTDQVDGMPIDIKVSFPPLPSTNVYAKLKKRLDGGYVTVRDNKLKFKYIEDYDIPTDVNDLLNYTIHDWHGSTVTSGPVAPSTTKELGVNWYSITLNLTHKEFYTLEVTDAKGEKYYLRFQYWCPSSVPCEAIYTADE